MHPDTSKKSNHAEFVKVNEAYKVLSKEHTRKQYDMEMRNRMPGGHPIREYVCREPLSKLDQKLLGMNNSTL